MAHCTSGQLSDLADVLAKIRRLPGVLEARPGIFHIGRTAFLHFHARNERRWADARCGKEWGDEIPIDFDAPASAREAFLRVVAARHRATFALLSRTTRRA
jgi:hypothetical protein